VLDKRIAQLGHFDAPETEIDKCWQSKNNKTNSEKFIKTHESV
jgi:hypothetical protein